MESKEFYRKVNEYIKEIKKKEIVDFVNNILRKIPEYNLLFFPQKVFKINSSGCDEIILSEKR